MDLNKIALGVRLEDGESVVVTVHPATNVAEKPGRQGGTTYSIPVVLENGKTGNISGGSRLIAALQEALADSAVPMKLKITALGDAGTTERDWKIVPA